MARSAGARRVRARAREVLAQEAGGAEGTLRKEVASGGVGARRVMAQLLLRRGTARTPVHHARDRQAELPIADCQLPIADLKSLSNPDCHL